MNQEVKAVILCPSCLARYRVPERLLNSKVVCRKCGSRFTAVREAKESGPPPAPKTPQTGPLPQDLPLDVSLSQDRMAAYLGLKSGTGAASPPSIEQVRGLLESTGIRHGMVEDAAIAAFLESRGEKPLKVAAGDPPVPGKDAAIRYLFETDPLKIGTLKEDGTIDFRDRGEIPHVKAGEMLAEKTPLESGKPGKDVLGRPVEAPKPKDLKLRCGKGAEKSEDDLRVYAKSDGQPVISPDGKISVIPVLKIGGDVGLETGHVEFDGRIEVGGTIQDGYVVKGARVDAGEILAGEIECTGDVVVLGGVLGAHIKAGGNLKARYVRGGRIEAAGDVVVENEVLDSEIETSGSFHVENGKILSSHITAKKGIVAGDIGSEASKPCTIAVGADSRIERQIQDIRNRLGEKRKAGEQLASRLARLAEKARELTKQIGELAQVQDRALVKQREWKGRVQEFERSKDAAGLNSARQAVAELEARAREAEGALEALFKEEEQNAQEMEALQSQIKACQGEIQELSEDIPALAEWSKTEKGKPVARVKGKVFAGTVIKGICSSLIVKEDLSQVLFRETLVKKPDSEPEWEMRPQKSK